MLPPRTYLGAVNVKTGSTKTHPQGSNEPRARPTAHIDNPTALMANPHWRMCEATAWLRSASWGAACALQPS
ncbi:hypothetical protein WJX77_006025 [Trebouxia sp. C0004]